MNVPAAQSLFTCCIYPKASLDDYSGWQFRRNKQIENHLKREKKNLRKRQMILLLGTGESGKSTFLKQMKIINGKHFSPTELAELKDIIYDNIYKGMLFLLQARQSLDIPWVTGDDSLAAKSGRELEEHFKRTHMKRRERGRLAKHLWLEEEFIEILPWLHALWQDGAIRTAFDQRSKVITENFSENTRYYLNRLNYIGVKNYCPTNEDIVWSRKPTETIIEEEFTVHHASIVFIDVGGQTKERGKWCQFFSNMTSVLFLIACSHYDEHYQDRVTREYRNKLREAMIVFASLINHVAFKNVSIIIFFNKTDILKEKLTNSSSNIRNEFPNYPDKFDPFDVVSVQTFLVEAFASLINQNSLDYQSGRASVTDSTSVNNNINLIQTKRISQNQTNRCTSLINAPRKRMLYRHFTTAVDRHNIEAVFIAMQDTVLQNNLRRIMMN